MSRLAPTSTPRVGSSSTTTRGSRMQHLGERELLLVAARQRRRRGIARSPVRMPKSVDRLAQRRALGAGVEPRLRVALERHQREVLAQAEVDVQALALAVLAQIGEAVRGGVARVADAHRPAVDLDRAARARAQRRAGLRRARCGPRRPGRRSRGSRPGAPRSSRRAPSRARVRPRTFSSGGASAATDRFGGIQVGQFAPDHQVRHLVARELGGRRARDEAAVAHHDHLVGDALDLVELVRDVDDGHAVGLAAARSARTGARSRRA